MRDATGVLLSRWLLPPAPGLAVAAHDDLGPYLAPEARRGTSDGRSDVYAAGVLLLRLMAGRDPTEQELRAGVVPAGARAEIAALLARCLRQDPAERFQSTRELLAAFTMAEGTVRVEPAPQPAQPAAPPAAEPMPTASTAPPPSPARPSPRPAPSRPTAAPPGTKTPAASRSFAVPPAILALAAAFVIITALSGVALWLYVNRETGEGVEGATTPEAFRTVTVVATPYPTVIPQPTPEIRPLGWEPPYAAIVIGPLCSRLREFPGTSTFEIRCLAEGAPVSLRGDVGPVSADGYTWMFVTDPKDGRSGWMAAEFLLVTTRTVRVGLSDNQGSATLLLNDVDVQPDGDLIVQMAFHNPTSARIPWTNDTGNDEIYLTDDNGTRIASAEAGAAFGRNIPDGIGPGQTFYGWHRFEVPDLQYRGRLTLHYPNHGTMTFDLSSVPD
jgi:hypothetical protein